LVAFVLVKRLGAVHIPYRDFRGREKRRRNIEKERRNIEKERRNIV